MYGQKSTVSAAPRVSAAHLLRHPQPLDRPESMSDRAIFQELTSLDCRVLFVFHVLTSSSASGAIKNECLTLVDTILTVETGCANVQITECAVWLLHSRPIDTN
jgi:hypothetical protein